MTRKLRYRICYLIIISFGLQQTFPELTRVCDTRATLIDNVFIKTNVKFESLMNKTFPSHHYGQEAHFELPVDLPKVEKLLRRVLLNNETTSIRAQLEQVDWDGFDYYK
ncbi:hypothetical protein Trydic_g15284 [Trypoxylus dichotomus]